MPITVQESEVLQLRCLCNKLLSIRNGEQIEIKCNKCKRVMVIETRGILSVSFREDR